MAKSKVIGYFNRPVSEGIIFDEPSCTYQQYKEESDLNNIVDRNFNYKDPAYVTKLILAGKMSDKKPIYGDFTQVKDYLTSLNIVNNAKEQFAMLPAKVRDRFHNNPVELLAFVNDENNIQEGIALGLYEKNLVNADLESKASVSAENVVTNVENAGVDTVSAIAPETST